MNKTFKSFYKLKLVSRLSNSFCTNLTIFANCQAWNCSKEWAFYFNFSFCTKIKNVYKANLVSGFQFHFIEIIKYLQMKTCFQVSQYTFAINIIQNIKFLQIQLVSRFPSTPSRSAATRRRSRTPRRWCSWTGTRSTTLSPQEVKLKNTKSQNKE